MSDKVVKRVRMETVTTVRISPRRLAELLGLEIAPGTAVRFRDGEKAVWSYLDDIDHHVVFEFTFEEEVKS